MYAGKMPYDPEKDFAPISMVAKSPSALAVHTGVPATTLKEFIALAKASPGKLNYGTSGVGSGNHLMAEMFRSAAGIDIVHVPYSGGGPGLAALVAREVDAMVTPPPTLIPMAKAGRIRLLAVSSSRRSPAIPEVPTIAESGFPGFEATIWYAVVAPRGTPKAVIDRLNVALNGVVSSAVYRDRLAADAAVAEGSTPEAAAAFIRAEVAKWAKVIRSVGIKAD
jgi:tripartite-type tricarboxylate transporter receptor subunit TctC